MPTVSGTIYLGATEEDPVGLQLLQDDGITPIDLTGCSNYAVRMRNTAQSSDVKNFGDNEISVTDEEAGIILISQAETDFLLPKTWEYYVTFDDASSNKIRVPKDGTYPWIIAEAF